ncbi:MAG: hypothetical protein OEW43_05120 [Elusimicrobiota bacterium]|nr:hypothetical protein [Elusimicrobiota bacterium]
MKIFVTVSLIFFSAISCFAKESSPILYNSFDGIPIGAKPTGMGEAFVALADNADAPYWNPAGLAFLESNLSTFMFDLARSKGKGEDVVNREPLQGKWFTYLSFCSSLGALSWRPLSSFREEDKPLYSEREINISKYTLSFAIPYTPDISFGMNLNYLHGSLGIAKNGPPPQANISTGNGWGLDWGILYTHSPSLKMGLFLENGPAYIYWSDYRSDRLPLNLRVGMGIKMGEFFTFASDFEQRFYVRKDGGQKTPAIYHLGLEYVLPRNISIRLGTFGENFSENRKVSYTWGLGFIGDRYILDFALKRYYLAGIGSPVYSYLCSLSLPF